MAMALNLKAVKRCVLIFLVWFFLGKCYDAKKGCAWKAQPFFAIILIN
jgi:hypothetical protein